MCVFIIKKKLKKIIIKMKNETELEKRIDEFVNNLLDVHSKKQQQDSSTSSSSSLPSETTLQKEGEGDNKQKVVVININNKND
jgi:hypothetical protein